MTKKQTIFLRWEFVILLVSLAGAEATESKFIGTSSCASSACHGNAFVTKNSVIQRNEFTIWERHDRHSGAWKALVSADAKRIARHLGIKNPESDERCLTCHATYVESALQKGADFREEEGVGCESCHGAAENYLKSHSEYGTKHSENLKKGMIDLLSLYERGAICLDCHLGSSKKIIDHRFFGSGHPRLTFELDTFQAIQPAHWKVDADYKKRKAEYSPARGWLVGQILRAQRILEAILSPQAHMGKGALKSLELSLLYCSSCHHSLKQKEFHRHTYAGKPGELRVDLSSVEIVGVVLTRLDSDLGKNIRAGLNQFLEDGDIGHLKDIQHELSKARRKIEQIEMTSKLVVDLLRGILKMHRDSSAPYELAEQIAMAASSLLSELYPDKNPFKKQLDKMYKTLDDISTYSPEGFEVACDELSGALGP